MTELTVVDKTTGEIVGAEHHDYWNTIISDSYNKSLDSIFETGRNLIAAKDALGHGEWGLLTGRKGEGGSLPFGYKQSQRFMAIAQDLRLSNGTHVAHLPHSMSTLYELTKLSDTRFNEGIESGAINNSMERKDVTKIINAEKKAKRLEELQQQTDDIANAGLPVLENKYHVISIDPPWPYEDGKENTYDPSDRRVANPYPEMSIEEIAGLQIPAADDCVMWLWTTHRFLPDSFDLLKEWGFEYKATMVWNKEKIGMGHWLRMQCEFCLLAIKGEPGWDNTTERDILTASRREHSRKPDEFFNMVELICHGAKFDYFSRQARDGWDQLGNDNDKFQ